MWVGLLSWLPAGADCLFSLVLACWLELLTVVVDLVGGAGGMAGVVMVGKQGGEGEQDRKKRGGGCLLQLKAR